jgi:HAMP domain-containing protein
MSNDEYLVVSYWAMAALSAVAGCAAWVWLRNPMERLAGAVRRDLLPMVRRIFPAGLVLPAIAGFCSVSYRGCVSHTDFASIVADRSYLVAKTHEQAQQAVAYLKWAVLVWCVFAILMLIAYHFNSERNAESGPAQKIPTAQ